MRTARKLEGGDGKLHRRREDGRDAARVNPYRREGPRASRNLPEAGRRPRGKQEGMNARVRVSENVEGGDARWE